MQNAIIAAVIGLVLIVGLPVVSKELGNILNTVTESLRPDVSEAR